MTSDMSDGVKPASFIAISTGFMLLSTNSDTKDSNFALVILYSRCFGPEESAVT